MAARLSNVLAASLPLFVALVACTGPAATAPAPPPASATVDVAAPASSSAPAPASASAAPTATPSAATSAAAAPVPVEAPAPPPPLPDVKVSNIGMHIGGGPNDAPTKEPIRRSVEPHFDAFRACFAELDDKDKGGDLGVDLRIERGGGKAKVSHPRTALKGKPFEACVVRVFEAIEFLPPKGGTTTVSYSLRFTPAKASGASGRKAREAQAR